MKTNLFTSFGLAFTVALMTMTSCSQNENEPTAPMEEKQALNISVVSTNFNNVAPEARAVTDANHAVTFEQGDKMGLFAVSADKVILNNVPLTYDANNAKWVTEGGRRIYYYEGADYIAYYPYANVTTPTTAADGKTLTATVEAAIKATNTIPNDQSTADAFETADLMMATKTASEVATNQTLNFTLAHQNAMIEFVLPAHKMKYPKAGKTTASTGADDFIEFNVPMSEFTLTSLGTTATTESLKPYAIGDSRTFRMIVPVGTVPQFAGNYSDPNGNMPVSIANTNATTALTAGNYQQYKVTKVMVDSEEVTYPETATAIDIIGSYLCKDGSILPYEWVENGADASNAVGIIFGQVGESDFANTDKATAGYNYYAVAIKAKSNVGFDLESGAISFPEGMYKVTENDINNDTDPEAIKDMKGYASTQALIGSTAGNSIKTQLTGNYWAQLDNTSGWFVPSGGQWAMMIQNLYNIGNPATVLTWVVNGYGISSNAFVEYFLTNYINYYDSTQLTNYNTLKNDNNNNTKWNEVYWSTTLANSTDQNKPLAVYTLGMGESRTEIAPVNFAANNTSWNVRYLRPIIAF